MMFVTKTFRPFIPLVSSVACIIVLTLVHQWYEGFNLCNAMADSMGLFFIIFGSLKLLRIHNFVDAFCMYDLIAMRIRLYAYCYPCIELVLGFLYLMRLHNRLINSATLFLMILGCIGVIQALQKKQNIVCACMGTLFEIPLTWVTLLENSSMGLMALYMLLAAC